MSCAIAVIPSLRFNFNCRQFLPEIGNANFSVCIVHSFLIVRSLQCNFLKVFFFCANSLEGDVLLDVVLLRLLQPSGGVTVFLFVFFAGGDLVLSPLLALVVCVVVIPKSNFVGLISVWNEKKLTICEL